jgi:hypothetical protein
VSGWRHNDDERQWEYGYYDLAYDRWIGYGLVTDEAIERVMFPAALARRLWSSFGSLPPPLAEFEPPPVPIVYAEGAR